MRVFFFSQVNMTKLPRSEVYLYFFVWISGVSISLYRLFLVGQVFDHRDHDQYHYEDFKNGWTFLGGRFQDQSDSEWNTWTKLIIKLIPFLLINLIGAEIIRSRKVFYVLPVWYTFMTVFFLMYHFSAFLMLWFLIQTLVYCVFIHMKSYILVWFFSFAIITFIKPELWFVGNEDHQYLIMVSSSWMVLRCISYSLDKLKELNREEKCQTFCISDILILLGYSFYLPTMFCGPFISYSYFNEGIKIKAHKWTFGRLIITLKNFLRCVFWFFFTIFSLHFIYVNAILLRPKFVRHLLDWELAGLGIAMGHFFHLKYVVFYGIPCAWAAAEGFTTPKLPCCVSRVHLYSYMWRHFDHGLYQFLVRYIYIPIISRIRGKEVVRKTVASILCFTFVFIWHGQHDYVFFWVLLNFIAVTTELVVKQILGFPRVRIFIDRNFSPQNQIRFQCFLSAPLHCFSMISNYFFIGNGVEIGFIYFNRIVYGSIQSKFMVLFFLYGAGQSAVATQIWEKRKEKQSTLKKS